MLDKLVNNRKIQLVALAFALSLFLLFLRDFNPMTLDANFGIEFVGGVRVPISLEHGVDSATMESMVNTIKTRINKFGLSQAVVRPLGDKEIIVEIPQADASVIKSVETILREQGRFEAIVDGKLALAGSDVLTNAVGGPTGESVGATPDGRVEWSLAFAISGDGEMRFADAATGKKGYPVLMFLDRPEKAVVIADRADVSALAESSVREALKKEGDDIALYYTDEVVAKKSEIASLNKTSVVLAEGLKKSNPEVVKVFADLGFTEPELGKEAPAKKLLFKPDAELKPELFEGSVGKSFLTSWKAIGLRSAPTLNVEPIKQRTITQYSITGSAQGETTEEMRKNAVFEIKELKSILSGGKFAVSTVIGSYYNISPSLGRQFLYYSIVGLFLAVLAVTFVIALRYRRWKLVVPIFLTNVIELFVLFALLGALGTLDLSAMAGVVALIGTGVDNQIIITDELLKKKKHADGQAAEEEASSKEKLKRAFYIVFTTAGVAIASMLPLLLSGIVEVMGFALSTILGVIIGVLITRPAYGALVEEMFGFHE